MSLEIISEASALREIVRDWRRRSHRVGLVPTMGNLHDGHMSLVANARSRSSKVIASVFINPLQFGRGEDYGQYPRTLEADQQKLAALGVDLLFHPSPESMYPRGLEQSAYIEVPGLTRILCGADRPGHFIGVATVVCKLFNIVRPQLAVFGEKDFQQLLVIRRMAHDLNFDLEIIGAPTVREEDGLAMSSRNAYLDTRQRAIAPILYNTLCTMVQRIRSGARDYLQLEEEGMAVYRAAGANPDYLSVRTADTLEIPSTTYPIRDLVVLTAARLGRTRLIDNVQIADTLPPATLP